MPLMDNGVYVEGHRIATPASLDATYRLMNDRDGMAWIGLYRPDAAEVRSVASEFDLHPLAVEDALTGHQRSKLERYGDTLFCVLRPARYLDEEEEVEFGELHIFVGPDFVVTIRHAETQNLARTRIRVQEQPELLRHGSEAVLYAILDGVVDEYEPVVNGLENDIDEIEDQLFGVSDDDRLSKRIYDLSREVITFQRAVQPLTGMLTALERGAEKYLVDEELAALLRDVKDHTIRINERIVSFRAILDNALTVHSALVARRQTEVGIRQNEEVKTISSWAAILFAPTLVGTVYGMNFDVMPETHWEFGYPFAVALMLAMGVGLYAVFKWRRWL